MDLFRNVSILGGIVKEINDLPDKNTIEESTKLKIAKINVLLESSSLSALHERLSDLALYPDQYKWYASDLIDELININATVNKLAFTRDFEWLAETNIHYYALLRNLFAILKQRNSIYQNIMNIFKGPNWIKILYAIFSLRVGKTFVLKYIVDNYMHEFISVDSILIATANGMLSYINDLVLKTIALNYIMNFDEYTQVLNSIATKDLWHITTDLISKQTIDNKKIMQYIKQLAEIKSPILGLNYNLAHHVMDKRQAFKEECNTELLEIISKYNKLPKSFYPNNISTMSGYTSLGSIGTGTYSTGTLTATYPATYYTNPTGAIYSTLNTDDTSASTLSVYNVFSR